MDIAKQIMGGKPDPQAGPVPKPNRAQRRAAEQERDRRRRRGQRAFDRQTGTLDFDSPQPTRRQRIEAARAEKAAGA